MPEEHASFASLLLSYPHSNLPAFLLSMTSKTLTSTRKAEDEEREMDASLGQNRKHLDFICTSVSFSPSPSSPLSSSAPSVESGPSTARFRAESGVPQLRFELQPKSAAADAVSVDLRNAQASMGFSGVLVLLMTRGSGSHADMICHFHLVGTVHNGIAAAAMRLRQSESEICVALPSVMSPTLTNFRNSNTWGVWNNKNAVMMILTFISSNKAFLTIEQKYSRAISIGFRTEDESKSFHHAFDNWKRDESESETGSRLENGSVSAKSKFDCKIEPSSAKMYFHYYGQLLHQQNMLQDYVRTGYIVAVVEKHSGEARLCKIWISVSFIRLKLLSIMVFKYGGTYYAAVIENRADFHGHVVVDVGAGSGILSLFAAQAGAKHVYAVEASDMAEYARKLIAGNPSLSERITVIKGKVEDVELPEKADILISEPMEALPGTLLVNERMLETYVIARDRFLIPNGRMFPTIGRIHMAPFSDEFLYVEIANKALFWQQQNYYGVDLTPLHGSAFQGYFGQPVVDAFNPLLSFIYYSMDAIAILIIRVLLQPVVDAFDPRLLVAPAIFHTLDFTQLKEEELYEIEIPLKFTASVGTRVHGLACWFDVLFNGSTVQRWLTTAPGSPTTHWYQLRCVLCQPLYVMAGQEITGRLHMVAHNAQSYTMHLTMSKVLKSKMWGAGAGQGGVLQTSSGKLDLKEPYYRMSQPQAYAWAQDQQPHQQLLQSQIKCYILGEYHAIEVTIHSKGNLESRFL
ncbi:Histone-arginine methyltransferase carm1 [Asimina triloba]